MKKLYVFALIILICSAPVLLTACKDNEPISTQLTKENFSFFFNVQIQFEDYSAHTVGGIILESSTAKIIVNSKHSDCTFLSTVIGFDIYVEGWTVNNSDVNEMRISHNGYGQLALLMLANTNRIILFPKQSETSYSIKSITGTARTSF
jgi:hypothetical protein